MAHPDVHDSVKEALRALTTSTVKVAGTEGHKTMLRHLGHAMNLVCGPATVFATANYPDVRTPFVSLLDAGPAPSGGSPGVDLLRDAPAVPPVVALHRILARNPVAGARYFLLMQELFYLHGLGFDRLWFGRQSFARYRPCDREDGYACSTQPCIGGPLKAGFAPNEAQGRGFCHSRCKGHGVCNLCVERMRKLLAGSDEDVAAAVRAYQEGFLAEATTVQYDDALELGAQLPFPIEPPLPPVPFTQRQRMQSRMDGGTEEDGTSRDLVPLAPEYVAGHVAREALLASAESRRPRSEYQIPLDGCPSSTMPTYRLLGAFGRCARLDACGRNPAPVPREVLMDSLPLQLDRKRAVEAFLTPDGTPATQQQIIEESKTYGAALCHDARTLQVACHSHDCTFTCVKNQKKRDAACESLKVHKTPLCRFHFFRTLRLSVETVSGWVIKAFRRRGKALVPEARVAATDDHGELGRAEVVRRHPFTSSTTAGGLVLARGNTDFQYINRCPPPDAGDGTHHPEATRSVDKAGPRAQSTGAARPPVRTWFSGFCVSLTEKKQRVL